MNWYSNLSEAEQKESDKLLLSFRQQGQNFLRKEVFGAGNTWFHWDETFADYLGPFETREAAEENLQLYIDTL